MSGSTFDISSNARHLAHALMDVTDADGVVDDELYEAWMAKLDERCALSGPGCSVRATPSRPRASVSRPSPSGARVTPSGCVAT